MLTKTDKKEIKIYDKIHIVINSCRTKEQLEVAKAMVDLFEKQVSKRNNLLPRILYDYIGNLPSEKQFR